VAVLSVVLSEVLEESLQDLKFHLFKLWLKSNREALLLANRNFPPSRGCTTLSVLAPILEECVRLNGMPASKG